MENKLERLAVAAVAMATGPSKSAKHPSAVTRGGWHTGVTMGALSLEICRDHAGWSVHCFNASSVGKRITRTPLSLFLSLLFLSPSSRVLSSLSLRHPTWRSWEKSRETWGRDERAAATLNINRVASASAPWKPLSAEKNAVELNRPLLI